MTNNPRVDLFIRQHGKSGWMKVDPFTPRGRQRLAYFRFPPERGNTMSAMPHVVIDDDDFIHENNVTQMREVLDQRSAARKAWDAITALPRAAWNWAKRTFHLEGVGNKVRAGYNKVTGWARMAVDHLGTTGMLGLGLTTMATSAGRSVISFLLAPVRWTLGLIGRAWLWCEDHLPDATPGKEGSIRNKVANGMANIREWVENQAEKVAGFYLEHLASIFRLDSLAMRTAKVLGLLLLLPKAISAVALLPIGGIWLAIAQIAVGALFGLSILNDGLEIAASLQRQPEVVGNVKEGVEDLAKAAGATVAAPMNRAQTRAAQRAKRGGTTVKVQPAN